MKITINDKEYGLQWGMGAIEIYCDKMNCDMDGLDKITSPGRDQIKAIVTLILSGLTNYSEINETALDVSYKQLQVWLDEAPQDQYRAILEDWKASKYFGRTISEYLFGTAPETTDVAVKKKSRSARS